MIHREKTDPEDSSERVEKAEEERKRKWVKSECGQRRRNVSTDFRVKQNKSKHETLGRGSSRSGEWSEAEGEE